MTTGAAALRAQIDWRGHALSVDFARGTPLAIPLDPHGRQPSFFTAEPASAQPLESGDYVGSVARGGSCNAEVVKLVPHCHGTHTECRGHLSAETVAVQDNIYTQPCLARLLSLAPEAVDAGSNPRYTAAAIRAVLEAGDAPAVEALAIRSLPNDAGKQHLDYAVAPPYPVPDRAAMACLAGSGLRHLLLDTPSLDPARDGGALANHRTWWGLDGTPSPDGLDPGRRSVTEMIFAPDSLPDGLYWMHLELSPLVGEATPSRPMFYPVEVTG